MNGKEIYRLMSKIGLSIILLLYSVACSTAYITVKHVSDVRHGFFPIMGNNSKLLVMAIPSKEIPEGEYGSYVYEIEKTASSNIREKKYFTVSEPINMSDARKMAIEKDYLRIKKEFNVDSLLIIKPSSKAPEIKCDSEQVKRYRQGSCLEWSYTTVTNQDNRRTTTTKQQKCDRYEQIPYTVTISNINFITSAEGILMNLNTMKSIQFNSKPQYDLTLSDTKCNNLSLLKRAYPNIARELAIELSKIASPTSKPMFVPVYAEINSIPKTKENKEFIKELMGDMKKSLNFVNKNGYDFAKDVWLEILKKTDNKSAVAYWNLAMYNWHLNKHKEAMDYVNKSEILGDVDWDFKIKYWKDLLQEQYNTLKK